MESLHIRFETQEAISSKRELLSAEINLLELVRIIQNYSELRKKELTRKAFLRARLRELTTDMKKLRDGLPKTKMPAMEEAETEKVISEELRKDRLEDELKEIKEKLARLS